MVSYRIVHCKTLPITDVVRTYKSKVIFYKIDANNVAADEITCAHVNNARS